MCSFQNALDIFQAQLNCSQNWPLMSREGKANEGPPKCCPWSLLTLRGMERTSPEWLRKNTSRAGTNLPQPRGLAGFRPAHSVPPGPGQAHCTAVRLSSQIKEGRPSRSPARCLDPRDCLSIQPSSLPLKLPILWRNVLPFIRCKQKHLIRTERAGS